MIKRNLHIIGLNIYGINFFNFINDNFNPNNSSNFFIFTRPFKYEIPNKDKNYIKIQNRNVFSMIRVYFNLISADTILIHGLYDARFMLLYLLTPKFKKKAIWLVWGGDLINPYAEISSVKGIIAKKLKKVVISRIRSVAATPKEFEHLQSFSSESRIRLNKIYFNDLEIEDTIPQVNKEKFGILIGNSSSRKNNHKEILTSISKLNLNNKVIIYLPLSYGDMNPNEIVNIAEELFPGNVVALREFLPLEEYKFFLKTKIDIALFNNYDQLGFSNFAQLVSYGKKVYLHKLNPLYSLYKNEFNFFLYDISKIESSLDFLTINQQELSNNLILADKYFSRKNVVNGWSEILSQ